MLKRVATFFLGMLFGACSLVLYEDFFPFKASPLPFVPAGFPILEKKGFTVQYDSRSKIPYWTQENIDKDSLGKRANRQEVSFRVDANIDPLHQSVLKDYRHSRFDRGHMVPAANQRISKEALYDTFLLSNICPQTSQLNRGAWAYLENFIRNLVQKQGYDKVFVTTGPLFLPQKGEDGKKYITYQVIGENHVAVPTHFFKFIQASKGGAMEKSAYILPNTTTIPKTKDFSSYEVSIAELEKVSGLILTERTSPSKHHHLLTSFLFPLFSSIYSSKPT